MQSRLPRLGVFVNVDELAPLLMPLVINCVGVSGGGIVTLQGILGVQGLKRVEERLRP